MPWWCAPCSSGRTAGVEPAAAPHSSVADTKAVEPPPVRAVPPPAAVVPPPVGDAQQSQPPPTLQTVPPLTGIESHPRQPPLDDWVRRRAEEGRTRSARACAAAAAAAAASSAASSLTSSSEASSAASSAPPSPAAAAAAVATPATPSTAQPTAAAPQPPPQRGTSDKAAEYKKFGFGTGGRLIASSKAPASQPSAELRMLLSGSFNSGTLLGAGGRPLNPRTQELLRGALAPSMPRSTE